MFRLSVTRDGCKQPFTIAGQAVMINRAGGGDEDASRAIPIGHEGNQRRSINLVDRLDRAENRQRQRMTLPKIEIEEVMDEVVGSVFGLRDFLQHDLALAV